MSAVVQALLLEAHDLLRDIQEWDEDLHEMGPALHSRLRLTIEVIQRWKDTPRLPPEDFQRKWLEEQGHRRELEGRVRHLEAGIRRLIEKAGGLLP